MSRIHDHILQTVGNTPVVRLDRLAPKGRKLYAKIESFNPMGSVKDRLALGLIEEAERSGALEPGQTVIEATSGNTGIGLAMVCARKGYPLVIVMAENFSIERRKLMRFLGAKVVLTPAPERGIGMLNKARELADAHGWFLCRQFENEANADIHSRTTAREILDDFDGERLDYWVTGFGTGGTLKGVARVLKAERPETKVVICEPDNSPVLSSGVPQPRGDDGEPSDSHPCFRTHPVQGWSPDFVPKLAEDAVTLDLVDAAVPVGGDEAMRLSRELARKEGIFVGISAGATLAGALRVCKASPEGTTVLCMLPDTGERYLTTPLFDDVPVEMTDEELEISRSTEGARFDVEGTVTTPLTEAVDPLAATFIDKATHDSSRPVVVFSLEYCEFCWSALKLFDRCGVAYRTIEIDSTKYDGDGQGDRIRAALRAKVGSRTVPQIFIGGELLGGCTELFEAYRDGRLQRMLTRAGVSFDATASFDPESLLPGWLHSRKAG